MGVKTAVHKRSLPEKIFLVFFVPAVIVGFAFINIPKHWFGLG